MNCIFCEIIEGKIPSYTIYEDEIVKVFLDVNPSSNGHLLIIPKVHTLDMDTIDDNTLMHIMKVGKKMKNLLEEKLNADGISLLQNNGISQEVKHYHLHVRPRYKESQEILPVERVYEMLKEFH